jgi:8-oxo-dGTP pyrophosphatase MutT (NUDIX family)
MLDLLSTQLQNHRPKSMQIEAPQAAVLIAVTECHESPEIIFTRRASHLNSHAGQVAFPGGKQDPEDRDLLETALRESEEEIALSRDLVTPIGQLSQVLSHQGILVTPFVAKVPTSLELKVNEDELDAIFNVPLSFFRDTPPARFDCIKRGQHQIYLPSYDYQEYEIWGLSAWMLVELMNLLFDRKIDCFSRPQGIDVRER